MADTDRLNQRIDPNWFRGDGVPIHVPMRDSVTGATIPVGGIVSITARVRALQGSSPIGPVLIERVIDLVDDLVDSATSTFRLRLTSAETAALSAGKYYIHFRAVDATNPEPFTAATSILLLQEGAFAV